MFIEVGSSIMYFLVLSTTSIFFLTYLKRISQQDQRARHFFKYFFLYAILISIIYFLQSGINVTLIIDCYVGMSEKFYRVMSKCGNILILIIPIVTTAIVGFHPEFSRRIVPETLKMFRKKEKEESFK